jgi:hypothetical protein
MAYSKAKLISCDDKASLFAIDPFEYGNADLYGPPSNEFYLQCVRLRNWMVEPVVVE